jgi:hypothetical protein
MQIAVAASGDMTTQRGVNIRDAQCWREFTQFKSFGVLQQQRSFVLMFRGSSSAKKDDKLKHILLFRI